MDGAVMRWIYLAVIGLFAAAIIIFALQNLEAVTIAFLGLSFRAPLAVLSVIAYILGAITGGNLFALLRRSVQASRTSRSASQ
jgi:lipopolysaccharide assembly protein A